MGENSKLGTVFIGVLVIMTLVVGINLYVGLSNQQTEKCVDLNQSN